MTKDRWTLKEPPDDGKRGWEADELLHLRYFRSLSMTEKIRAVEEMCRTAEALKKDSHLRKHGTS